MERVINYKFVVELVVKLGKANKRAIEVDIVMNNIIKEIIIDRVTIVMDIIMGIIMGIITGTEVNYIVMVIARNNTTNLTMGTNYCFICMDLT